MKFYYIGDKIAISDKIDSEPEIRILSVESEGKFGLGELEGPYSSIEELKKNSDLFQSLKRTDMKKVQKILDKKNILEMRIGIISYKNKTVTGDFLKLIDHSIRGKIKSKEIFGIHHFEESRMTVKEMIRNEDTNGVWEAIVEVTDFSNNKSYSKKSTFFPRQWSLTQLFHECDFAFLNKKKIVGKDNLYFSTTTSGVPVHIIIKDGEAKSIYPLHIK